MGTSLYWGWPGWVLPSSGVWVTVGMDLFTSTCLFSTLSPVPHTRHINVHHGVNNNLHSVITGNSTTTEQMWTESRRHSWSSLEPNWILIFGGEGVKISIYQEILTHSSNCPLYVVTYLKICNLAGCFKVFFGFWNQTCIFWGKYETLLYFISLIHWNNKLHWEVKNYKSAQIIFFCIIISIKMYSYQYRSVIRQHNQ